MDRLATLAFTSSSPDEEAQIVKSEITEETLHPPQYGDAYSNERLHDHYGLINFPMHTKWQTS
jgi:hypothetical protein